MGRQSRRIILVLLACCAAGAGRSVTLGDTIRLRLSAMRDPGAATPAVVEGFRTFVPDSLTAKQIVKRKSIATSWRAEFQNTTPDIVSSLVLRFDDPVMLTWFAPFPEAGSSDGGRTWIVSGQSLAPGDLVTVDGQGPASGTVILSWHFDEAPANPGFAPAGQIQLLAMPNSANVRNEVFSYGGFAPGTTESDQKGGMIVGKSFLVFVNFFDAHAPRDPPPDLMRRFLPPGADPSESRRIGRIRTSDLEFGEVRLTAQEQGLLSCLYDAEVARADRGLGALVSGLASRGLLDGTVLAVTADHGENFGEKGMWGHHLIINESLLHVPLLVRYPARFPPGRREPALVQIHDLFPTLLELAGVPRRAGENRQPTLFPESLASSGREFAFAEEPVPTMVLDRLSARFPGRSLDAYNRALWSATDGRFKAVLSSRGERWLYDLDTDPREERDLSASMPEVMSRLTAALEEHIRIETARRPAPEQNETMPSELIEQLRVLGYVK